MIYVIRAADSMMVKIGFTKSPKTLDTRVQGLKTGYPLLLRVEATMLGSKLKERCLHSFCISRHESGEWFRLSCDEVKRMVAKYKHWTPAQDGIRKMSALNHQLQKQKKKEYFK